MRRGLGIDVTMQDLREVIDEHHWLLLSEDDEEKEIALNEGDSGHRNGDYERNYRNRRNKKKNRFNGNCNNCGKIGHKAANC